MKRRLVLAARVMVIFILLGSVDLRAAGSEIPKPLNKVRVEKNVMIPMRDGAKMATDIYFPVGLDKAPAILSRTPYGKNVQSALGRKDPSKVFAGQGYVVLVQDVRGRYGSEGKFYPFLKDGDDGQDTISWIQKQPWFNGRIGTYGASYLGTTQWFEAPGEDLSAMHLVVTSPNLKEVLYTGGELHLETIYFWSAVTGDRKDNFKAALRISRINRAVNTLPLSQADDRAGGDVKYFDDALDASKIFEMYRGLSLDQKYNEISAPAVFMAGWYDMFEGPQLKDFNKLVKEGKGNAAQSILIIGPWAHGSNKGDGSIDFGEKQSQKEVMGLKQTIAWFDHWLKGEDNEIEKLPKVKIFVMGENAWHDENEWPLARTQYVNYYFHSQGKANTLKGDGLLSTEAPASAEPQDKFTYNPRKPVPTKGGNSLGLNLGPYNQASVESRKDVLCFTSAPLEKDTEVTGPVSAVLYAASDAKDTDFTVKLVDVYPDGRAINIQDGVVRAMYRDNDPTHPTPLAPGAVEKYNIDLWATSNVFKAGHKIRVEISSSNFPRFNRNLNTGEPAPDAVNTVKAGQVIYHDSDHPSHIVLPLIPR